MERKLTKKMMSPDINDSIAMLYFSNIEEYIPIKGVHLLKMDIGALPDVDIDVLQAGLMHGITGAIDFASVAYFGPSEDIRAFAKKHMEYLDKILSLAEKRMVCDIEYPYMSFTRTDDPCVDFILQRIIETRSPNIIIAEIMEVE